MTGIIFIGLSLLILILLAVVSKKNRQENNNSSRYQSHQKNQKNEISKSTNTTIGTVGMSKQDFNSESTDSEDESLNINIEDQKNESYEAYSPKSYKNDEEYKRMASLVKNIYFTLVAVMFVILGILYIIFFK